MGALFSRSGWEGMPKRSRYLVLGASLLVAGWLGLILLVEPGSKAKEALRDELSQLDVSVTTLRAQVTAVTREASGEEAEKEKLRELQRRLEDATARLPEGSALSSFLRSITDPRGMDGISFVSITPKPLESRGDFLELPFSIVVETSFQALRRYLAKLEALERLVNVENISLRAGTGDSEDLLVTISAATYLLKEEP